jgi:hypothetical protein
MRKFVLAPYGDGEVEFFVDELRKVKDYEVLTNSLKEVRDGDRLYFVAHGSSKRAGVCVDFRDAANPRYVTGEDVARHFAALGLRDEGISLRLWVCWSGKDAGERPDWQDSYLSDTFNEADPYASQHALKSFALRVACGLKGRKFRKIEVKGYTEMVSLTRLAFTGGAKKLIDERDKYIPAKSRDNAVRYSMDHAEVKAI